MQLFYSLEFFLLISLFINIVFITLYILTLRKTKKICNVVIENAKKEVVDRLYKDDLTPLKNKKALEDYIENEYSVVAILLDVDSFEDLNELYGFINAELVLVEIAKVLQDFEKKYNVNAYRLSGDIFCLINKTNMPFDDIFKLIEEIKQRFFNKKIFVKELKIDTTISLTAGISIFQEDPILTASIALKKAKSLNQSYFVYHNELNTKELIIQSLYWRQKIQQAVEDNKIIPFYQPIVDRERNVIKYETLMRIEDLNDKDEKVFVTPDKFLGISFKTRQYLELSRIIIEKSFENLLKTKRQITINLSFKDILNVEFIEYIDKQMLNLRKEDRNRLVFEILESENLSDYDFLEEFIKKYKNQGVKIAIDDFGSGYSNFLRIIRIKPDYLKLDGSLIKNIDKDKNSYEIVKSIVAFSKTLNIKTIAEYVHSEEIFGILMDLDVDEFQGYYFGKPDINFQ